MKYQTMKTFGSLLSLFLLALPLSVSAGWQVAKANATSSMNPFFPVAKQSPNRFTQASQTTSAPVKFNPTNPTNPANPANPANAATREPANGLYAISVSGSLKENLERIMGGYQWKVVWNAPYDYNFDGRITGSSLPSVVEKLLKPFPLKAVMYMSNRTVAIVPRTRT
jgi:hypothetical protein